MPGASILPKEWGLPDALGLSLQAVLLLEKVPSQLAATLQEGWPPTIPTDVAKCCFPPTTSKSSWLNFSLCQRHSKHLLFLLVKAKNLFTLNLCLPSPSGPQVAVKFKSEPTDFASPHKLSTPHFLPLIWCKIMLTKQEDETFNASQILIGMQNKCIAKHFQSFPFSTSSLYSKNKWARFK